MQRLCTGTTAGEHVQPESCVESSASFEAESTQVIVMAITRNDVNAVLQRATSFYAKRRLASEVNDRG